MLIDLRLNEINIILKSYDNFCLRVNQADALLTQQMAGGQNDAIDCPFCVLVAHIGD